MPEELGLDGILLGEEELGCADEVPVHSVLHLQLFMFHHDQNLLVGAANEVPGGRGCVPHDGLQVENMATSVAGPTGMVGKRISS